jgi:hypothetical protein
MIRDIPGCAILCLKGGEMAETVRRTPEGFLTMAEARAQLGVSKVTMARLVKSLGVKTYDDPRDARIKLLTVRDVEDMQRPTIELGPIIARWQERFEQTNEQLVEYLEMPADRLASLKAARLRTIPGKGGWRSPGGDFPDTDDPSAAHLQVVAEDHNANPRRLFDVFMGQKAAAEGKAAA